MVASMNRGTLIRLGLTQKLYKFENRATRSQHNMGGLGVQGFSGLGV